MASYALEEYVYNILILNCTATTCIVTYNSRDHNYNYTRSYRSVFLFSDDSHCMYFPVNITYNSYLPLQ